MSSRYVSLPNRKHPRKVALSKSPTIRVRFDISPYGLHLRFTPSSSARHSNGKRLKVEEGTILCLGLAKTAPVTLLSNRTSLLFASSTFVICRMRSCYYGVSHPCLVLPSYHHESFYREGPLEEGSNTHFQLIPPSMLLPVPGTTYDLRPNGPNFLLDP